MMFSKPRMVEVLQDISCNRERERERSFASNIYIYIINSSKGVLPFCKIYPEKYEGTQ